MEALALFGFLHSSPVQQCIVAMEVQQPCEPLLMGLNNAARPEGGLEARLELSKQLPDVGIYNGSVLLHQINRNGGQAQLLLRPLHVQPLVVFN